MTVGAELQGVFDAYVDAYRRGDAAGCSAVFAIDAFLVSPFGPAARGRDAIKELHQAWVAEGGEDKSMTVIEYGQRDDLAWCLARFSEGDEEGVSLAVFDRQADGRWLIRMCSLNE